MLRIEHVQDIETLRQMALLLDHENQRLVERIRALQLELSQLRGEEAVGAQRELAFLQDVLARRERIVQGHVSEKRSREDADSGAADREPQRGHGPRSQPKLPIVEQVHELPQAGRVCKACGGSDRT